MTSFNPLDLLISPAYAQAGQAPQGGGLSFLIMPIVLIAVMYFLMIRPQMKRAKEHRAMLEKLGNGDEVITNGGMAGVVREIGDSFITIRSEEHTSEIQSLMRISYAVFSLKKKKHQQPTKDTTHHELH